VSTRPRLRAAVAAALLLGPPVLLAACAAPAPAPPPSTPAAAAPPGGDRPNLRSAAPEEAAPTADEIAKRCRDYAYEPGTPEWDECVRLEERVFMMGPKRFVWPGQTPGG
jgi:hypothetical protein